MKLAFFASDIVQYFDQSPVLVHGDNQARQRITRTLLAE